MWVSHSEEAIALGGWGMSRHCVVHCIAMVLLHPPSHYHPITIPYHTNNTPLLRKNPFYSTQNIIELTTLKADRLLDDRSLQLHCPQGFIEVSCVSKLEKESWLRSVTQAIWGCVGEGERVFGWRHQYYLGTLHSAGMCMCVYICMYVCVCIYMCM